MCHTRAPRRRKRFFFLLFFFLCVYITASSFQRRNLFHLQVRGEIIACTYTHSWFFCLFFCWWSLLLCCLPLPKPVEEHGVCFAAVQKMSTRRRDQGTLIFQFRRTNLMCNTSEIIKFTRDEETCAVLNKTLNHHHHRALEKLAKSFTDGNGVAT